MGKPFGKVLEELRISHHMTMRELAGIIECSAPHLCDIEKGRRNPPPPAKLAKIAQVFQLDLGELLALAQQSRMKVEIRLDSKPGFMHDVAFNLARAIDEGNLSGEAAQRITDILNQQGKAR